MPRENEVLDEIQREVKGFGDDVKSLKTSMERDLAEVRRLAEDAQKTATADHPETKAQIEALTTSVAEKHTAMEKLVSDVKEQADRLETAMKRSPRGTSDDDEAAQVKDAVSFYETKAAVSGNLAWRNRPTAETADIDGYRSWVKSFGTYLRANDEREVEAKALSVGSNPDGGYLVPTARSQRIIQMIRETSPLRQLATVESIGTDTLEIPIDIDEAGAGWVGELQERSETTTPQVGTQRIVVHEMYAKPKATQKFLEDASINVEEWLATKVADRFSRVEATAFVTGDGVGKPRGILTYAAGTGRGKIPQIVSGEATVLSGDLIVKLPFRLKSEYLSGSSWLMKRSTVESVMLFKDGQGQYMWRPGLTAGAPSILVGYEVRMADDMPVVQAGSLPIAFGNFRRGYTVVDRLGITTLRDPYSAKPFVEFYSRKRVGGDVVDFDAFVLGKVAAA